MEVKDVSVMIAGIVMDPVSNTPIVILKDVDSDNCLPIWVGAIEASAITAFLKKVERVRPMTHDLISNVTRELGGKISKVVISKLENNTFHADLEISSGDKVFIVDSRPSDAIALAVSLDLPIYVKREVFEQAQVSLIAVDGKEDGEHIKIGAGARDFDKDITKDENFTSVDESEWEDILEQMEPEDFKYKM